MVWWRSEGEIKDEKWTLEHPFLLFKWEEDDE